MSETKEISVFLSWQSDSDSETNCNAIRKAIKTAGKRLSTGGLRVQPDEATRGASGSPNIFDQITKKIRDAQIFVADITTVTQPGAPRASANPNVLIELGYAIGELGWDRIILLFNRARGQFPQDLPFDIVQNRVSPYYLDVVAPEETKRLNDLVEIAIKAVIDKDPKRPAELRGLATEVIHHKRDIENITWILSQVRIPRLDDHIESVPNYIDDDVIWYWIGFKAVWDNSLFHLYDEILREAFKRLTEAWQTTLAFDHRYHDTASGRRHVFSSIGDATLDVDQQHDWQVIRDAGIEMRRALDDVLARVRGSYVEVDLKETNRKAFQAFKKSQDEDD